MSTDRLDKFISQLTPLSRSMARRSILAGEVCVNGTPERDAGTHVAASDTVSWRGEVLEPPRPRYVMLHKPLGVVCATEDGSHRTVIDLLREPWRFELHVAGRLDIDTTGLVLLTDDGAWSHRITSPRHKQAKRYIFESAEPLQPEWCDLFAQGIMLQGEEKPTLPAQLEISDDHHGILTLHEGRYHQVKRMLAAVGSRVTTLHREAIGGVKLDPALAPGEYRELSATEIGLLAGKGARPASDTSTGEDA